MASKTVESKNPLVAMAFRYGLEPEQFKRVIKATCNLQNARDEDFMAFLLVAHEYGLNPLTKEIYGFVKPGGGIQPILGVDGWYKKMLEHPAFQGIEFRPEIEGDQLIAMTAMIRRKDLSHPIMVTEYMHECKRNTDPWKQWPARMLRHKAAIQCIRVAFNLAGLMDPDEAERYEEQLSAKTAGVTSIEPDDYPTIKVIPPPRQAGGAAGGTERVEPPPPQDGGRKTKAPERSAAPNPPPVKEKAADPDEIISLERQLQIMERVNTAGIKSSDFLEFIQTEFGVGGLSVTSSQAAKIDQFIKEHAG